MAKKQATPEQKEAAEARRAKLRELCKRIADMDDAERVAMANRFGAILTCEGHPLSLHNTLLLIMQLETVSMIGGFQQWRAQGRFVRKGERALGIWIPTSRKGEDAGGEDGDDEGGKQRFIFGSVFDVSQTDESSAEVTADLQEAA